MILFPCVVLCTLLDAAPRLIKTVSGISNTKHSLGIQGNNQRRAGTRQGNTRKYFLRQGIVGKEGHGNFLGWYRTRGGTEIADHLF